MRSENYDAVAFDMDGVIFDSEQCVAEIWRYMADKYNLKHIDEILFQTLGTNHATTKRIVLSFWGEDFPFDKFTAESSKMYHDRYDGGRLPMKPGVKEILEFLKCSGKKIALASSTRTEVVVNQLRDAGIIDYFDAIVGGDQVKSGKPAPDIFLKACESLGTAPCRTYAIEDSYNGIRSASAGGLLPIMVPDMLPANDEMKALAETVEENLAAVIEYLK